MRTKKPLLWATILTVGTVSISHAQSAPTPTPIPVAAENASGANAPATNTQATGAATLNAADAIAFPPPRTAEEVAPTKNEDAPLSELRVSELREREAENTVALSLVGAIALSLQNNPQREAALATLRAAEARIGTARSNGKFQASLSGSANTSRNYGGGNSISAGGIGTGIGTGTGGTGGTGNSGFSIGGNNTNQSLGVSASLPIYDSGRVKSNVRSVQASARAQAANTLQIEQQLVESTITTYLDALRNAQLLEVAENNLNVSRERRRVAGERFRVGSGARLDVLTANTALADARQRRIEAANTYSQSKSTLNILMGRAPETPLRLETVSALTPRVPLSLTAGTSSNTGVASDATTSTDTGAQLRTVAEQNNPTLAANRAQIEAANADVETAKAARRPSFGLSLSNVLSNPIQFGGRFLLSLGLSVSQTLFDSGRAKSQINEARALSAQASANLRNQQQNVASDIDAQLLTLDSAQERLTTADEAVLEAQQALVAAQAGYAAGARTSLEVTNAQANLLTTQTDAANARFDVANAQAQISTALGVLTEEGQRAYTQALDEQEKRERDLVIQAQAAEAAAKQKKKQPKQKKPKNKN